MVEPVNSFVRTMLSLQEVRGLNPGSVESGTVSPTTRHRCDGVLLNTARTETPQRSNKGLTKYRKVRQRT